MRVQLTKKMILSSKTINTRKSANQRKKHENWPNEPVLMFYKKIKYFVQCSLTWGVQNWSQF